jgi:hypothetical protein
MGDPIPDKPACDVPGCGAVADQSSTGEEVDHLERAAIPHINTCAHHINFPHSPDGAAFAATDKYRKRVGA